MYRSFLRNYRLAEMGTRVGVMMKQRHTIIAKYPYKLKLTPGQPGAQEEFDRALCQDLSGKAMYLEWSRE